jgi:hypothetical protein
MKRGYQVIKISPCPSFPKRGTFLPFGPTESERLGEIFSMKLAPLHWRVTDNDHIAFICKTDKIYIIFPKLFKMVQFERGQKCLRERRDW